MNGPGRIHLGFRSVGTAGSSNQSRFVCIFRIFFFYVKMLNKKLQGKISGLRC
jgi:hypothetical protein